MNIHVLNSYEKMSQYAAHMIEAQMQKKHDSVLGLATGGTPEGLYKELIRRFQEGRVDFKEAETFNLDEYIGLGQAHPQSYSYYMWSRFFSHVNIDRTRIYLPFSKSAEDTDALAEYDIQLQEVGGIDLQLLGIGQNGHIGFNEPGSFLRADTHYVDLSLETVEANARFFSTEEDVPKQAITMGMAPILQARSILLLASGKTKARAVKEMLQSAISPQHPASFLQLHSSVDLVLDAEAAMELPNRDFVHQ
ncbi:glucosamine-6-phosphate deaminase [Salibacterium salarium]|uniref:Glucosamine-6-phosphate deaminase n=1 Tax=Salibacterium salarium TaxID=284579 RepID=A0A428MZI1_9BACI|nr:glucosamine-6-phosphate deaminase [Salibacterium salarium]RSL31512.1 glucosamine-6-phosphate deaminase [Salibacterium salarium]